MPLENRNVEPGTVLVARYKGKDRTCEVVQTDDGLRYRLDDGTEHKSPSSAGKAAMGGVACNGWRFWSLAGTEKPARKAEGRRPSRRRSPSRRKGAAKGKAKKPAKAKGGKKATAKGHRMAAKGDSYGCGACRRELPDAEGGRRARAHAHQRLTSLPSYAAAGRFGGLLSFIHYQTHRVHA